MAARFEVHRAVHLGDRYLFGLSGVIEEGMVQTGMTASMESEDGTRFEGRVHGVEYMEEEDGVPEPILTFHYRDPAKLERWQSTEWEGKKLHLEWVVH